MKINCKGCGYTFESESGNRCPRCNMLALKPKDCESCKGCLLFSRCKIKKD